jgi:long-chain acyl-CoA synthetase
VPILEGYGQTEGTTAATCNLPDRFRFGTVGPALPNVEVRVADDGEILLRGPTVFAGYFGNEEATREVLGEDGWLRTGDVGELDDDGFLTITDRKRDIIITAGGKNLSPANIENKLKGSPYVSQALVIGDRRPFVSALITLDPEEAEKWAQSNGFDGDMAGLAARAEVRELVQGIVDAANSDLARFEQVRTFAVLPRDFLAEENEVTPTMKLRRKICQEHFADEIEALYTA